jgi:hypothetical protein
VSKPLAQIKHGKFAQFAMLVLALRGATCGSAECAQPDDTPVAPARQPETPGEVPAIIQKFQDRLAVLSPAKPEEYLLLGEEVADQAVDVHGRRLATELLVLAFDLSVQKPATRSVAAGACLALAELRKAERDRRWLVALARTLDPRRVPPEWLSRPAAPTTDSTAYQFATAMGLVRSGEGVQARQILDKPDVKAALDSFDRMMSTMGITGGAGGIVREAQKWPCPECGNDRIKKNGTPPEARICPVCSGDPGPELTPAEFIAQLRFESMILQGAQRSWSAQVAADGGAPLVDPDEAALAGAFDVDTTLDLWRDGHWVADPNAPTKPAPPAPPRPPVKPKDIESPPVALPP